MDETSGTREELAVGRTVLAMDRTLMAWVRTALSLSSFGFTIYKFFETLESKAIAPAMRPNAPRNLGIFLVAVGTVSLGMALLQYWLTMVRKLKVSRGELLLDPAVWLATTIWLMGVILLLGILTRLM